MAVLVTQELPGVSQKLYDGVNEKINAVAGPPAGLIVHASGPADGGWRIVDVWESAEDFERFREERLRPAVMAYAQEAGVDSGTPQTTLWELHDVIKP